MKILHHSRRNAWKLGLCAGAVLICVCIPETTRAQSESKLPSIRPLSSASASPADQEPIPDRTPIGDSQFEETRIEAIKKRLQLLKDVIDRDQSAATEPKNVPDAASPIPKLEFPDKPAPDDVPPEQPAKDDVQYMTIEAKPIDPIQLGNNLFLGGLHDAAYKSYDSIETKTLPAADVSWAMCMKACCLRHVGQFEKAEPVFRSVVRLELAPIQIKDHASWNLEYLQDRIRVRKEFDALAKELNELKTRGSNE